MSDPCREAFEKWANKFFDVRRVYKMDGNIVLTELEERYPRMDTHMAWESWQAAWNQRAPRWIPVSERLPEVGVRVLRVGLHPRTTYNPSTGWMNEDKSWSVWTTHWQPLPEAPNE